MATVAEALLVALGHHEAGRAAIAEELYRRIIAADPEHPHAHHLLGVLRGQAGDGAGALVLFRKAVALIPDIADFHVNLAKLWRSFGREDEAERIDRHVLVLRPEDVGLRFTGALRFEAAGWDEAAAAQYRILLALDPVHVGAWHNLGLIRRRSGKAEAAVSCLFRAARGDPESKSSRMQLGSALTDVERAIASFTGAACLDPTDALAFTLLGQKLRDAGRCVAALEAMKRAARITPGDGRALGRVGEALQVLGRLEEALVWHEAACRVSNDPTEGSALILCRNLIGIGAADMAVAVKAWAKAHAEPLTRPSRRCPDDPDRPLRIGYLVENYLTLDFTYLPLIENHGPDFPTVVYALGSSGDDRLVPRYRQAAGLFRWMKGCGNDELAAQIEADGVDILVEGVGFASSGHRFLALAHRPAPIQIHFPVMSTTGVSAIDALLVDDVLVPPDEARHFREEIVRVPLGYHYSPLDPTPEPEPPPVLSRGHVTFGSFNLRRKIRPRTLEVWAEILGRVQDSVLMIKSADLSGDVAADLLAVLCGEHGIDRHRIDLRRPTAGVYAHMQAFNDIDIHLDTFPYGGITITAQAMWMGVPVVTLWSEQILGRYTADFCRLTGLDRCVSRNADGYVAAAVAFADDTAYLTDLRRSLRRRMLDTPLSDAVRFTRDVENAYRRIWRRRCA